MEPERCTLAVEGLCVDYGRLRAVDDCSFTLAAGALTLMTGHNGAGKSSCILAIAGAVPMAGGAISLACGGSIERHSRIGIGQLAARGVSVVPSGHAIFPNLTVLENLQVPSLSPAGTRASAAIDRVLDEIFPALRPLAGRHGGALSGGERQQLAIALSLVCQPRVLVVDEPSAGVAPGVVQRIAAVLRELADGGTAVLVAEQNLHAFLPVATEVLVMKRGRIRFSAPAAQTSAPMLWELL